MLLVVVFATGFSSMLYELALAQLLSSLLGNTYLRYAVTIGVYVLFMGLGSILYRPKKTKDYLQRFLTVELTLSGLGIITPFLAIGLHELFTLLEWNDWIFLILMHVLIAAIGFLSGYELPILSDLAEKEKFKERRWLLATDYFGMFAASILFPLVLFQAFGVFSSFWVSAVFNLFAVGLFLILLKESEKKSNFKISKVILSASCCLLLFVFIFSQTLSEWLANVFLVAKT